MTITGQSSLGKDDIDRMVRDAEAHAEEDRRRRDEAEVRNDADSRVYQTEKLLRDQGDKATGPEKESVESALASLKEALNGSDIEAIKNATESLNSALQPFAQRLYEQGAADAGDGAPNGAAGATPPNPAANDDEVVDAEIVDEEKPA